VTLFAFDRGMAARSVHGNHGYRVDSMFVLWLLSKQLARPQHMSCVALFPIG
jgi:hypothetical protein